jgi:hypothetical protein
MKPSSPPTPGTFAWGRAIIARTGYLHRRAVGLLLQHNPRVALPQDLLAAAVKTLLGEGRRGPKPKRNPAVLDFLVLEMLEDYREKYAEFKSEHEKLRAEVKASRGSLPRAEKTPAEKAWDYVLEKYKPEIGVISREALRNLASMTIRVPGWKPPDCPPDFEDIERRDPSRQLPANCRDGNRRPDRIQLGRTVAKRAKR